jgi:hypothetical protein
LKGLEASTYASTSYAEWIMILLLFMCFEKEFTASAHPPVRRLHQIALGGGSDRRMA